MKRTGFKRPEYVAPPPAPPKKSSVRATMVATAIMRPNPKLPADRNMKFRQLAEGEACTVRRYGGHCRCHPDTTVLAHTNTQADQKGMGYKGHDSAGFFAGSECHSYIDQPPPYVRREEIDQLVKGAQARTRARLREIAASPTVKPWRRKAAGDVLLQLELRDAQV